MEMAKWQSASAIRNRFFISLSSRSVDVPRQRPAREERASRGAFKARGIPADLRTCHTAEVDRYVLEGHVPALAVRYLLHEKPENVTGLAVPGMPVGSPGMEVEGVAPEEYSVIVFGPAGRKVWNRFRGVTEINC